MERKKRSCTPKEEMDSSGIITMEAEQSTGYLVCEDDDEIQ
jgi:hypothetical protein